MVILQMAATAYCLAVVSATWCIRRSRMAAPAWPAAQGTIPLTGPARRY